LEILVDDLTFREKMERDTKKKHSDIPALLGLPFAWSVSLLYVMLAGFWIYFSDQLMVMIAQTPEQLLMLSTGKGWFFVVLTAFLLLVVLLRFTAQVRTNQQQIRIEAERYRITLQAIGDGVIVADCRGKVQLLNPVAEALTGWKNEDARGRSMEEIFPIINEESRQKVENPTDKVLRKGCIVGLANHTLLLGRDGVERPVADSGAPIRDEKGKIQGVVLVFRDQTEERKAQAEMQNSYERLRIVMDSVDAVIYIADMQTHELLFINEYGRKFWSDDVIGKKCWQILQGASGPCSFCSNEKLVDAEGNAAGIYQWEFQNQINSRWYDVRDRAITWQDGRHVRLEIATDITERKEAEASLRERERELQRAQAMAHVGSWRFDLNTGQVNASREAHRIYGVGQGKFTIGEIKKIPLPQYREMLDVAMLKLVEENIPYDVQFRIQRISDNVVRDIHSIAEYDKEKNIVIGTIHDITRYKQAEEALRRNEEFLANVMRSIQDGICVLNPDLTIRYTNPMMEKWYGERVPLLGQKCHHRYYQKEEPCSPCPALRCLKSREMERDIVRGSGGNCPEQLELCCYPMFDLETNEITGVIEFVHDISERTQLEEQLRQAQKMESVGRLAGGVAHDFNNMLSVIQGHSELALDGMVQSDPVRLHLEEIYEAARRSSEITRQLLAFARKQTIEPRVLDFNETVSSLLTMLRRLIGEDVDLIWRSARGTWRVMMDPTQVDQVLANLCVNARDAIDGVGRITIETSMVHLGESHYVDSPDSLPGDYVVLAVSDDGCGMDKKITSQLFEPFFTTKAIGKGTGLGLATVYGIVRQNNGFITVHSEPGQGTTFKVYLPRYNGVVSEKLPEESVEVPRGKGETILIVEDETAILDFSQTMLERLDYLVLVASTPSQAMRIAEEYSGKIDMLVTDVVMPEMNGRDLAEYLTTQYPSLKKLFMSGYTADVIAHHGVLEEGVQFLEKPFSAKDFAVKVRQVLDASIMNSAST
ncbi:MAG: PAS domain S-box protein, partial [Desulfopila sp.]|nr:PAS domain S-box protein [Desulfopila sp.]